MTDVTLNSALGESPIQPASRLNLDKGFNPLTMILFFGVLAAGTLFVAYSIYADVEATGARVTAYLPFILLFVALLIALGFEFVNGFHDTANAVATVIYTHSLPAEFADRENDLNKEEVATLKDYKAALDNATKFIPT